MGINSTEVSYGFGQLGSVYTTASSDAVTPPTNKVFVAITMLADTVFDSSGGFVIEDGPMTAASGFAGEASGSPPRGQQVQRASAGDAVDAVAELGRHYHTLQTWGELYDNDQWNPSASYLSWPTIASAFPSTDNKALTSDPTGRNIPPYIKLTYIKKD